MSFVPVATAGLNNWNLILIALEKKINRESYEMWLKPTRFSYLEGKKLFVRIPSSDFQHVGDRYADLIQEAIDDLGLDVDSVTFITPAEDLDPSPSGSIPKQSPLGKAGVRATAQELNQSPSDRTAATQLNPRYRFDSFVIGSGNQFAAAASQAIARSVVERPSKTYNPLFLYGKAGMGKTHLIHAIGNDVKQKQPHSSVVYVSSRNLTDEMMSSYRGIDVLLIDDIQLLTGDKRTQEELFHILKFLRESGKQIVVGSDCPPEELPNVEDQLQSMFKWGMIGDIQPLDLETKVAILQKKVKDEQMQLPSDVASFIASSVWTNVRDLENTLVQLITWCRTRNTEITLTVAQQCLRKFVGTQKQDITIETIQQAVADQFGMSVVDLKQNKISRQIKMPRQLAMYLATQLTEASLIEIGKQFGGKHRSTVIRSIAKFDEYWRMNRNLNKTVSELMDALS
jgi:chromosomal replication initiator protein